MPRSIFRFLEKGNQKKPSQIKEKVDFFSKYLELPKIVSASFHDDFLHQRWFQSKISMNNTLLVTWDFKNHIHLIIERQLRVEAFHLNHGRVGKGHVENWLPILESESNLSLPQINSMVHHRFRLVSKQECQIPNNSWITITGHRS